MLFVRALLLILLTLNVQVALAEECVILLHGLARTSTAMNKISDALSDEGYKVANIGYPSRKHSVEALAELVMLEGVKRCEEMEASPLNIVTHSLGGILVRYYLANKELPALKHVVMLGPPNQGSEIVDKMKNVIGYELFNGPAGMQLGTAEDDMPLSLGPVTFKLGVIAGNKTINPLLSQLLPNPDDGKVSVERTKVEGMCSFLVLPVSHALIMRNDSVIEQVIAFLKYGEFELAEAENGLC